VPVGDAGQNPLKFTIRGEKEPEIEKGQIKRQRRDPL